MSKEVFTWKRNPRMVRGLMTEDRKVAEVIGREDEKLQKNQPEMLEPEVISVE